MNITLKSLKRIVVAVVGFTIIIIGVLMIVLPGPAFIIIPLGLAILASEFIWARKILDKVKHKISEQKKKISI